MFLQHYSLISKPFGCIPNDLIIAKLPVHGFENDSLKLIQNYLSNREARVKVNSAYNIWKDIFLVFRKVRYLNPCFPIYSYVKQKLQKHAYPSFSIKCLPVQAVLNRKWTQYYN